MFRFHRSAPIQARRDAVLGIDRIARTALEATRTGMYARGGYDGEEFYAFFSDGNYKYLESRVASATGGLKPEPELLFDAMMWAYYSVSPRSDELDPRRSSRSMEAVNSYVSEINPLVIERVASEVMAANRAWDGYARLHRGPIGLYEEEKGWGIDTRSRFTSSLADMFKLP